MEAKKLSISLKTIYIALGIIVVVLIGYLTVKIIFSGPSVEGRTFVSIPTISNQKIESMSFTKEGLMLEAEYSQETEKWKDSPFAGKYEISGDRLILTALGGTNIIVTPIKWLNGNKYQLVHNSDTITYALKGSDEDPTIIKISSIIGKTFAKSRREIEWAPYYSVTFLSDGGFTESLYISNTKKWSEPSQINKFSIENNKLFIKYVGSDITDPLLFEIIWINKNTFIHNDNIFYLKGSKDDPSPK